MATAMAMAVEAEGGARPVFCSPHGKARAGQHDEGACDCAPAGPGAGGSAAAAACCCRMDVDAAADGDWMDTGAGADVSDARSRGPAHAEAVERGGLGMAALKEAMTRESAAQEPLVAIIGALLNKTVQRNDALGRAGQLAGFEGDRICALPAADYLERIMRYGRCSPSCAVVGLIYLQRVKTRIPGACLTSRNLQRLLLVALLLANKFLDDLYFSNKHWAKIGGLTLQEVNALELSVLRTLDWRMAVTREDYLAYLEELGCGPPAAAADAEAWAADLERLRELVTSGAGIRLNGEPDAAGPPGAPAPSKPATAYSREMERAER
jgi:energy-converting hydrogenase Eha subunit C